MKEYEIVFKYLNACSGSKYPQISFEEASLVSPEAYIQAKHSRDFEKFTKEVISDSRTIYRYDTGGVVYIYEFTQL